MIIEDDNIVAKELKNLLISSNYEAILLEDYQNAKDIVLNSNIDLILLDINISSINGELLLNNIRKSSSIPIIMITSSTQETDEIISISYGADDYITKPYNPLILLLRISNLFKRLEKNIDTINYKGITINFSKGFIKRKNKKY